MKKVLFFLGLLIAQIIVIGLIVVIAFSSAFLIPLLSAKSPTFFIVGMSAMVLVIWGIPIISAVWAHRDVKKFINQGVDAWMPVGWVLVMLFFWFPGLTIYLFLRKFRYKMELKGRTQNT